jgi:hypothetical protein
MVASAEAALCLNNKRGIWSYKARSIRSWGEHYPKKGISNNSNTLSNSSRNSLSTLYLIGELVMFRQGLHYKTSSIITDEHVQALLLTELRSMKVSTGPQRRSKHYVMKLYFKIFQMPPQASVCRPQKDS